MKIAGILLAAALLLPAGLAAQEQPQPQPQPQPQAGQRMGGRGMMRSPVAIAIAHKADLNLTDDQVAKLDAIEKQLQEKNAPLREKMRAAMSGAGDFQSMTDDQRQAMREKMQPVMQELRANSQAARADAEKVLKPEQVTKLQQILEQEMPQRGPGMGPRTPGSSGN